MAVENIDEIELEPVENPSETPEAAFSPKTPVSGPQTIDLEPVSAEWVEEQKSNPPQQSSRTTPCSYFSCANGHGWPPEIGMATCPGCKAPLVAIRFRNCPVCNEPAGRWTVRVDRTSQAMGVPAVCKGQQGTGETHMIDFSVVQEKNPEGQKDTNEKL